MIRSIIIDDEVMAGNALKYIAEKTGKVTVLAIFNRAKAAKAYLETNKLDLIFLDIQMPDVNGIDFLKLNHLDCKVVLVSSDPSHGPEAFQLNVSHYLQKPVSLAQMTACIDRVEKQLEQQQLVRVLNFRDSGKLIRLDCNEIAFISTEDDYLKLHLKNGSHHLFHSSLKSFMPELPEHFIRVHQSYAVNLDHVSVVGNFNVRVLGQDIPVSRSKKSELLAKMRR